MAYLLTVTGAGSEGSPGTIQTLKTDGGFPLAERQLSSRVLGSLLSIALS